MRTASTPRVGRLRRLLSAIAIVSAIWMTATGAGPLNVSDKPAVLPALSVPTLAATYKANRRAIERALHAARRAHDRDRARTYAAFLRPGRMFLLFDPHSAGRGIEVIGDLAGAERIVILVPGADTSLTTFDTRGDKPYSTPGGGARAVYRQAKEIKPRERLAVVAWLGYHPPAMLSAGAVTDENADAGARALRAFMIELRRVNPSARTALLCHSYGSVVCGEAVKGLPVSEIAAFGSPGMSASTDTALGTSAHVWAGRGSADWIRLIPHLRLMGMGHGADPVSPGFGARVFDAGHAGHSDYLRPGSLSLFNLALIALGRESDVVVASGPASRS